MICKLDWIFEHQHVIARCFFVAYHTFSLTIFFSLFHQAHNECAAHLQGAVFVASQTRNPIRPDAGAILVRHFFRREATIECESEKEKYFCGRETLTKRKVRRPFRCCVNSLDLCAMAFLSTAIN